MTDAEFLDKYNAIRPKLVSYLRSWNNRYDVDDLLQDVSIKLYKYRDKYTVGTNYDAWAITVAKNASINEYRKKRKKPQLLPIENNITSSGDNNIGSDNLAIEDLLNVIRQSVPDDYYDLFCAVHHLGYSYQDAADEFGISLGTVKSRLFRCRQDAISALKKLKYRK